VGNSSEHADWPLLREGAVNVYSDQGLFDEARSGLEALDYFRLDFQVASRESFIKEMSAALEWEASFGYAPWTGHLDAFDEGIVEFPFRTHDRAVITISRFERLVEADNGWALGLLDVFQHAAWYYLAAGKRLIVLLQTDDKSFRTPRLGGKSARRDMREQMQSFPKI
jgi:hypothetical protein